MYIRVPARYGLSGLGDTPGPFEGTFKGTMAGDSGTSTTVTATLTHRGTVVAGTIVLGAGLQLGFPTLCAIEPVDLREIPITATWDPAKPQHIEASTDVQEPTTQMHLTSIKMKISIVADLLDAGQTLNTTVTMKPAIPGCWARSLPVKLTR